VLVVLNGLDYPMVKYEILYFSNITSYFDKCFIFIAVVELDAKKHPGVVTVKKHWTSF
jgi:hypothetical protein